MAISRRRNAHPARRARRRARDPVAAGGASRARERAAGAIAAAAARAEGRPGKNQGLRARRRWRAGRRRVGWQDASRKRVISRSSSNVVNPPRVYSEYARALRVAHPDERDESVNRGKPRHPPVVLKPPHRLDRRRRARRARRTRAPLAANGPATKKRLAPGSAGARRSFAVSKRRTSSLPISSCLRVCLRGPPRRDASAAAVNARSVLLPQPRRRGQARNLHELGIAVLLVHSGE